MRGRYGLLKVACLLVAGCTSPALVGRQLDSGREPGDASRPPLRTDECGNGIDDDANGRIDDGCYCAPGETQACFSGPLASRHQGACSDGVQTCEFSGAEFADWGSAPCVGGTTPAMEQCDGMDHDCDGARDEDCPCLVGETIACGIEFLTSPCSGGTQTCSVAGTWSGCEGAIGPTPDLCDGIDNDCDGTADVGCGCVPQPEVCRDGRDNDCDGEIDEIECTPDWCGTESCGDGIDNDCDGLVDEECAPIRCDPSAAVCGGAVREPSHAWSRAFASTVMYGDLVVDDAGGVIAVGGFQETVDFGGGLLTSAGASDVFIVSLDSAGAHRWSRRFGGASSRIGPQFDVAEAVAIDSRGDIVMVGTFEEGTIDFGGGAFSALGRGVEIFYARLDSAGAHRASRRFGGTGVDRVTAMTADTSGGVVMSGTFSGEGLDFGGGPLRRLLPSDNAIFVASLDSDGAHRWSRAFGGDRPDVSANRVAGIAVDEFSNVYVTGTFEALIDFGGGALSTRSSRAHAAFVASFNATGAHRWSVALDATIYSQGGAISVDRCGNMTVSGSFNGRMDIEASTFRTSGDGPEGFMVSYDRFGAYRWSRHLTAPSVMPLTSAVDSDANVYIAGEFMGTADFGTRPVTATTFRDAFLAAYDREGRPLWSRGLPVTSTHNDATRAIGVSSRGDIAVLGWFLGSIDIGGGSLPTSIRPTSSFLAKLSQCGG